jgi:hypothetical protein
MEMDLSLLYAILGGIIEAVVSALLPIIGKSLFKKLSSVKKFCQNFLTVGKSQKKYQPTILLYS